MNRLAKMFSILAIGMFSMGTGTADIKYQVKKGDNLFKIGQKFGIPHEQIMLRNGLERTVIFPNQQLVIPSISSNASSSVSNGHSDSKVAQLRQRPENSSEHNHSNFVSSPVGQKTVTPFASARKLPETHLASAAVGQLGKAYQTSPYKNPPILQREIEPHVIAHKIPLQAAPQTLIQVDPRPELARTPELKGLLRSHEVAAVAHYPNSGSPKEVLNTSHFPTPSFNNASKPVAALIKSLPVRTYTVCEGDSVNSISRKFGVGGLALRRENNIMFSRVKPGMQLRIPD